MANPDQKAAAALYTSEGLPKSLLVWDTALALPFCSLIHINYTQSKRLLEKLKAALAFLQPKQRLGQQLMQNYKVNYDARI